MNIQETVRKDSNILAQRLNELGLSHKDISLYDWNPGNVIILYEESAAKNLASTKPETKPPESKKAVAY